MTLIVSSYWRDPTTGASQEFTDWSDGHHMAGVERARWDLWGSDAVKKRGAKYLPRLAESDLWIEPTDLDAFETEVRMLLAAVPEVRSELGRGSDCTLPHYLNRRIRGTLYFVISFESDRGVDSRSVSWQKPARFLAGWKGELPELECVRSSWPQETQKSTKTERVVFLVFFVLFVAVHRLGCQKLLDRPPAVCPNRPRHFVRLPHLHVCGNFFWRDGGENPQRGSSRETVKAFSRRREPADSPL